MGDLDLAIAAAKEALQLGRQWRRPNLAAGIRRCIVVSKRHDARPSRDYELGDRSGLRHPNSWSILELEGRR